MKAMTSAFWLALILAVAVLIGSAADAATPPPYMNYQGVLRDNADNPLDGTHDMVFRFFSSADEEILIDRHTTAQGGAVTVSGGLFDVRLGAGATSDGSGPGTYGSLGEVFRDYGEVYLEVQIGADGAPGTEVLTPRTRVISAPYALNASNLAGLPVTSLLRSNESDAYTFGTLTFNPTTTLDLDGTLNMDGAVTKATTAHVANFNADLLDNLDSSAFAASAHGHTGGEIVGPVGEASSADTLDGHDSTYFLNTSAATQTKTGPLRVDAPGAAAYGVRATGSWGGGHFSNSDGTAYATIGSGGGWGIDARADTVGGYFENTTIVNRMSAATTTAGVVASGNSTAGIFQTNDHAGRAYLGYNDGLGSSFGVWGEGQTAGGYFKDADGDAEIYLGYTDSMSLEYAAWGEGRLRGAYFGTTSSSGHGWIGWQDYGVRGEGDWAGGYFLEGDSSAQAWLAEAGYGIDGYGPSAGGYFRTQSGSGWARVGYLDEGISAHGTVQGGFFKDDDSTGEAHVAYGNRGIEARGIEAGGFFEDSDGSGRAYVGYGDHGVRGYGDSAGGFFQQTTGSGYAYAGWSNWGVTGHGATGGGFFEDFDNTGYAYVGYGDSGIEAFGNWTGGYFEDTDQSAHAHVAVGNIGIDARGNQGGGYFADSESTGWSYVGYDTYKVWGTGGVSFVQNHPYESDRVVVYTAPEGDEVATYTRGSARLVDGEARVTLGKTFAWVTNPDIGLTAHVTPRSPDALVYVESITTEELVVRGATGFRDDAVFDYLVYGLRIGFEEKSVVQPKQLESYIPSMNGDRALYQQAPDLRSYNAFERFKGMREVVFLDEAGPLDLTASHALRDAIHEYDPGSDPPLGDLAGHGLGRKKERSARPALAEPQAPPMPDIDPDGDSSTAVAGIPTIPGDEPQRDAELSPAYPTFPVSEPVETGDLLVLDPENPSRLRRCGSAADANVIGIVVGDAVAGDGEPQVPVALSNLAVVKADAGYGEIRPGDLLTSSFTPGHAMRTGEVVPGTVIGKALEPLETGTGLIKVLVMPR